VIDLVAARMLVGPALHSAEHVPLDLDLVVPESRVVKYSQDVVHDFIDGDI